MTRPHLRSGKTSWAMAAGHPTVQPEALRYLLGGGFVETSEPLVQAMAGLMVRSLFTAGHADVIVDATNLTKQHRTTWISKEWRTHFIVMDTSEATCIKRATDEGDQDLADRISELAATLEPVEPADEYGLTTIRQP